MKQKYINYLTVLISVLASIEIALYTSTSLTVSSDSNFWDGVIGKILSNYTSFALIALIVSVIVNKKFIKKQKPSKYKIGIVWGVILLTFTSFVVLYIGENTLDNKNYGNVYKVALQRCDTKPVEITFIQNFSLDGESGAYHIITPASQKYIDYSKNPVDRNGNYLAFECSVSQAKTMLVAQGFVNPESVNDPQSVVVDGK